MDEHSELDAIFAATIDDEQRIAAINLIAWRLHISDMTRAIKHSEEALRLAERDSVRFKAGLAESLRYLGYFHARQGRYSEALAYWLRALYLYQEMGEPDGQVFILRYMGGAHLELGNYAQAMECELQALEQARQIEDRESEAIATNIIGLVQMQMGEYDRALERFEQSLTLAQATGDIKGQADVLDNRAHVYIKLGLYEDALDSARESLRIAEAADSPFAITSALLRLGDACAELDDAPAALTHLDRCCVVAHQAGIRYQEAAALTAAGRLHARQGDCDTALMMLEEGLQVALDIESNQCLRDAHAALYETYRHMGLFSRALAHHEQYHHYHEMLYDERTDNRRRTLEVQHEVAWMRKDAEIHQLRNVELHDTNTRLAEAIKAHQAVIDELDAFVHMVAHDLKNPIALINGYGQVLQMTGSEQLTPEQQHYLDDILHISTKMNHIVEELLTLAGVRQRVITPQPVDMAYVVHEAEARLQHEITAREAQITRPETWPVVQGYGPWVEEVWANYLSNALKYGGEPPVIELGAEVIDEYSVRFWVRDNGEGISKKDQKQLFQSFTRMREQRKQGGHGLGLSIVKRIVEKLGGTVAVKSRPGQGAEFSFTLPIEPQAITLTPSPRTTVNAHRTKKPGKRGY